ncbi:MAG: ADOP family duplicated permease [Gammaproteobacteria bacterium]
MTTLRTLAARVVAAILRRRIVARVQEEIETHRSMLVSSMMREGMSRAQAELAATREMGDADAVQEAVHEQLSVPALDSVWADLRYAFRVLRRGPAFAVMAIGIMALGIGLNTGIFTVLNTVLLGGIRAPGSDELVAVSQIVNGMPDRIDKGRRVERFSTEEYRTYRAEASTLSGLFGYSRVYSATLSGDLAQDLSGRLVTCAYFDVLQQPPLLGRSFVAADCEAGAEPVLLLDYDLWVTAFGADPGVLNRTITLNRARLTVIGVAPPDVFEPDLQALDYFAPISAAPLLRPDQDHFSNGDVGWLNLVGRHDPGVSIEQIATEFRVIAARIDETRANRLTSIMVAPATSMSGTQSASELLAALSVAMTPSLLVLLIVCANMAGLMLTRATTRSAEIALRISLGASRWRVVRQLLTEAVVLAVAGGLLGSVLAFWAVDWLVAVLSSSFPGISLPLDLSPDRGALAFALVLSVLTGVLCGLAPSMSITRADLNVGAKQTPRGDIPAETGRLRAVLLGLQVAVCVVLVITASVFVRGLVQARSADFGFDYENVLVATIDYRSFGYDANRAESLQRRLRDSVLQLPGVESAAQVWREPLSDRGGMISVRPGTADVPTYRWAWRNWVSPDYFSVIGTPLVRGRTFRESELADNSGVAIVTNETARRLWPGQDAIGQRLVTRFGSEGERSLVVIGVVRDAQLRAIGEADRYFVYLPVDDTVRTQLSTIIRSDAGTGELSARIRQIVDGFDADLAVRVRPLEANIAHLQGLSSFATGLATSLGGLALAIASLGRFGVVSYTVTCRKREIGIRVALGASISDVLRLILARTLQPVAIGAAVGVGVAAAASRLVSGVDVRIGVTGLDPVSIGGAVLLILTVALGAALWPARQGLRVDPAVTLRHE